MKKIKIITLVLGLMIRFSADGFCQGTSISRLNYSYNVLNAPAKSETVKQNLANVSNGVVVSGLSQSSVAKAAISQVGQSILGSQVVTLNYGVPDRVFLDRILLNIGIIRREAALISAQENYRAKLSDGAAKDRLIQMLQNDINNLESLRIAINTTCVPVNFKDYSVRVNADVKYKDPLSGVGLMRAENGVANFANIPYWEIEGQVKSTKLIYKK